MQRATANQQNLSGYCLIRQCRPAERSGAKRRNEECRAALVRRYRIGFSVKAGTFGLKFCPVVFGTACSPFRLERADPSLVSWCREISAA